MNNLENNISVDKTNINWLITIYLRIRENLGKIRAWEI